MTIKTQTNTPNFQLGQTNTQHYSNHFNWLTSSVPQSRLCVITQQLGEELLARNINNRTLRLGEIAKHREEIRRGNWHTTGQGISVSTEGILIDGQHRLTALQQENWPYVQMFVMTGIHPESKVYFDRHKTRTLKDVFDLEYPSAKVKSKFFSVLNYVMQYNQKWTRQGRTRLVPSEQKLMIPVYKSEIDTIVDVQTSKSFFAAAHYAGFVVVAKETGRLADVANFVKQVAEGTNLEADMPAYHLRNFVSNQRGGSGSNIHMERMHKAITACRWHLQGKKMKHLKASYSM